MKYKKTFEAFAFMQFALCTYVCSMGSSVVCMCGGVRDRYSTLLIMNRVMLVIEDVHMLSPHSKH